MKNDKYLESLKTLTEISHRDQILTEATEADYALAENLVNVLESEVVHLSAPGSDNTLVLSENTNVSVFEAVGAAALGILTEKRGEGEYQGDKDDDGSADEDNKVDQQDVEESEEVEGDPEDNGSADKKNQVNQQDVKENHDEPDGDEDEEGKEKDSKKDEKEEEMDEAEAVAVKEAIADLLSHETFEIGSTTGSFSISKNSPQFSIIQDALAETLVSICEATDDMTFVEELSSFLEQKDSGVMLTEDEVPAAPAKTRKPSVSKPKGNVASRYLSGIRKNFKTKGLVSKLKGAGKVAAPLAVASGAAYGVKKLLDKRKSDK